MSLRDVAARLGWEWCPAVRMRLLRWFKSRELKLGKQLLWRQSTGYGSTWSTTEHAMRWAFPEWYDHRDEVAIELGAEHEALVERACDTDRHVDRLAALVSDRTRALRERVEALEVASSTTHEALTAVCSQLRAIEKELAASKALALRTQTHAGEHV